MTVGTPDPQDRLVESIAKRLQFLSDAGFSQHVSHGSARSSVHYERDNLKIGVECDWRDAVATVVLSRPSLRSPETPWGETRVYLRNLMAEFFPTGTSKTQHLSHDETMRRIARELDEEAAVLEANLEPLIRRFEAELARRKIL